MDLQTQAARICHAGLERIGPLAGDLGPVAACPGAGPTLATRVEAGGGHGFKDLFTGGFGLQLVRPGWCDEAPLCCLLILRKNRHDHDR